MRVTFVPLGCAADTHPGETVLDAARRVGAPLGNSCGAVGICARCRIRVIEGAAQLAPPTAIEARISSQRGFAPDERLACQSVVLGDCTVTTTYW